MGTSQLVSGDDLRGFPGGGTSGEREPQDLAAVMTWLFRLLPATLRQEFLQQVSEAA